MRFLIVALLTGSVATFSSARAAEVPFAVQARIIMLEDAAKKGDLAAQTELASIYLFGAPEARDEAKAMNLLRPAVEKNYGPAEYLVGMGLFGQKDDQTKLQQGAQLLNRAADHGCAGAAGLLGNTLMAGGIARKDANMLTKGVALLERGAQGGDYLSQVLLARLYNDGALSIASDPVTAYAWIQFARTDRPKHAMASRFDALYTQIKGKLSPDDLRRGDVMAKEFATKYAKKKYPLCSQSIPDEMLGEVIKRNAPSQ